MSTGSQGMSSIVGAVVVASALLLSVIIGVQIASGDYYTASLWLVGGGVIFYLVYLHKLTWQIALLLSFLSFNYQPLGFQVNATHIGLALGMGLGALYLLSPVKKQSGNELNRSGLNTVWKWLMVWVIYLAGHFLWNHSDPYIASEYALKNSMKAYALAMAGPIVIIWFVMKPSGFVVTEGWRKTLMYLLFVGLYANIGLRIMFLVKGVGVDDPWSSGSGYGTMATHAAAVFHVPIINMTPNSYALRSIGPLAVLFATIWMTSGRWIRIQGLAFKFLIFLTFFGGVAGSLLGGGRASILIAGLYIILTLIARRRYGLIGGMVGAMLLFATLVNIFSAQINENAPFTVRRTLQYVMIEKGTAMTSIRSSTEWRAELAERAVSEWKKDTRVLLFGRGTFLFNDGDLYTRALIGGYEASMRTSLRRGATHRLITDCLLQYGLVGTIIFYAVLIVIMRFLCRTYRTLKRRKSDFADLAFAILTIQFVEFVLSFFASASWITPTSTWMLLLLVIGYRQLNQQDEPILESRSRGLLHSKAQR